MGIGVGVVTHSAHMKRVRAEYTPSRRSAYSNDLVRFRRLYTVRQHFTPSGTEQVIFEPAFTRRELKTIDMLSKGNARLAKEIRFNLCNDIEQVPNMPELSLDTMLAIDSFLAKHPRWHPEKRRNRIKPRKLIWQ